MSEKRAQFRLSAIFLMTAIIAAVFGFAVWLPKAAREADRQAIRSAYQQGRLTRERAIELMGDSSDLPARDSQ